MLLDPNVPQDYQPVPGAVVFPEDDAGNSITTDSSGKFTFNLQENSPGSGEDEVRLIIEPSGDFSAFSPIRCNAYSAYQNTGDIKKLLLHPNARNIKVGEVLQLYAKAVMNDGSTAFINPSSVTWQIDDENIATISSLGVVRGKGAGTAQVTIGFGGLTCTGRINVRGAQDVPYTISGKVSRSDGDPVKSAVVMITGVDTVSVSDENGNYAIPGLQGGVDLTLMVYYNGEPRYTGIINLSADTTLDIILRDQTIQEGALNGIVKDEDGAPLAGVMVTNGEKGTLTESDGTYSMSEIPEGIYTFFFDKIGFVPVSISRDITAGHTAVMDVTMYKSSQYQYGSISGYVKDSSGNGIGGASVTYGARSLAAGRGSTTTDSNGYFSFAGVPPGSYRIEVTKSGYTPGSADITVTAGVDTPVTISLLLRRYYVYAASGNDNRIYGYSLNYDTGELTALPGSPFAPSNTPSQIVIDPSGKYMYVANFGSNDISGYSINKMTGELTAVPYSPFSAGTNPWGITVDPSGKYVYATNWGSNNVSGFRVDSSTGRLTPIPNSPFAAGAIPMGIKVDPSGKYVYAANEVSCDISGFGINGTTGELTPLPGSPWATGSHPDGLLIDNAGKFVYTANWNSNNVSGFSINGATGALAALPGSPFGAGTNPNILMMEPSGKYVYVTNWGSHNVTGYSLDSLTGALTQVTGSPFGTSTNPWGIAADPSGKYVYVANQNAHTISGFLLNGATGSLTAAPNSPFGAGTLMHGVVTVRYQE